jgi:hypothetical protein
MSGGANVVLDKGYLAGAAVTQFRAVKFSNNVGDTVIHTAALTDQPIGVAQENATAGDATNGRVINIRHLGISFMRASGALATIGIPVSADAVGRVVASGANLNPRIGTLLTPAAALDDIVAVLLCIGAASAAS